MGSFNNYFSDTCTLRFFGFCTAHANLGDALPAVGNAYVLPTNFVAGVGPNGEGNIYFFNVNYGVTDWLAYTRAWSGSINCHDYFTAILNGNCNETTVRPDYADVTVNDWWYDGNSSNFYQWNQRNLTHEVGHVIGMDHHAGPSVMLYYVDSNPLIWPYDLQSWEISWINSNYPL